MELRRKEKELYIHTFETLADAEDKLSDIEILDDDNIDAVLVSMSKMGQLQSAYPNYFANTTTFTDFVASKLVTTNTGAARRRK